MGGQSAVSFLQTASRSRLELGDCLQAGCLQGEDEEFGHGEEANSLNHLLREVNPFSKLRNVWNSYAGMILRFLSI